MTKKSIIMVPYANDDNLKTGANMRHPDRINIHLKNCCVALLSAKINNPNSDIALVTNIRISDEYIKILEQNDILIIHAAFDSFRFPEQYKWGLAFYKLCALEYVVNNYDYDYYAYLDADVYVQSSFDNIWKECNNRVLLYDVAIGLQVNDYLTFLDEVHDFTKTNDLITQYGGELFASSKDNAIQFIMSCKTIYQKMMETNFISTTGDEFILSLAAEKHKQIIKNAAPYIFRFWTGNFRVISTTYMFNPITIIHTPDEKCYGLINIYKYFIEHRKLPPKTKVYKMLHLKRRKFLTFVKNIIKKILGR